MLECDQCQAWRKIYEAGQLTTDELSWWGRHVLVEHTEESNGLAAGRTIMFVIDRLNADAPDG